MSKKHDMHERTARSLLRNADIEINGDRPWDIAVHDDRFYRRVLRNGALGLGESYMDGWWDCNRIDQMIARLLSADLTKQAGRNLKFLAYLALSRIINFQSAGFAPIVGKIHYDIGNDLYARMLDKEMNYSCAYWHEASTLEEAQLAKLDLSCRKLGLQPGMRLLDIGCGWGAMARHAARYYGVEVVGVTISKNQAVLAQELCKGLPVEIRHQDYREINEGFDRIVSIGMFEHVGCKNYPRYIKTIADALEPGGLFLLHTIGVTGISHGVDPWVIKYIFPHAMLPTMGEITDSFAKSFVMKDWHNLGENYIKTLFAWHLKFNENWPELSDRYSERFRRMWNYFLLYFSGGFSAEHIQVWQILWSKKGGSCQPARIR